MSAAPPPARWPQPAPAPRPRILDAAAALAGLGFGAVIAAMITGESRGSLAAPGGLLTAVGRLAGLSGAYLMLIMVVLVARVPWLERTAGQARLVRWHRWVSPWAIGLIVAHVVFVTLGYAQAARAGVLAQLWRFLQHYPDLLAAMAGFGLLVMAGVTSYSHIRRRMRYETWWVVHLYLYLGLALAFAHQLATGLACRGRRLERLAVSGGQFFLWRFGVRELWWQAHPYSLSAVPRPPYLRVTIKAAGDSSRAVAALRPGTRVAVEGPYGTFTRHAGAAGRVALVGAGVGITPVRALLEDLPAGTDVVVVARASTEDGLLHRQEVAALVKRHRGRLHEVVGPRKASRLDARALRRLVPDLAGRDLYICGPEGFTAEVAEAAESLGLPPQRIHTEAFAFTA